MNAPTLEQQLDALIEAHGLSSITLARIVSAKRTHWAIYAHADGKCAGNQGKGETAQVALAYALEDLAAQRVVVPVVPDLAAMEQAA